MKRIVAVLLVSLFLMLPVVVAEGEKHSFVYNMEPWTSYIEEVPTAYIGDNLTLNVLVPEDAEIYINIYAGVVQIPMNELYNNNHVSGNFTVSVSTRGGIHTIVLVNYVEIVVVISGWWALNYNETAGTATTTTNETTPTTTTTTPWNPNGPVEPWFDIFIGIMMTWVVPALIVLVCIGCIIRWYKGDDYGYLLGQEEKELFPEGHEFRKEEKD